MRRVDRAGDRHRRAAPSSSPGVTVVIALCSLFVAGIPLVSHARATRPAIAVGGRRCSPRSPCCRRCSVRSASTSTRCACHIGRTPPRRSAAARLARGWRARSCGRPWPYLIAEHDPAARAGLPARPPAAGPVRRQSVLPTSTTSRQAYDTISDGFGAGSNGPLLIAVQLRHAGEARPARRRPLDGSAPGRAPERGLEDARGCSRSPRRRVDPSGTGAVFSAIAATSAVGVADRGSGQQPARHGDPEGGDRART